MTIRDATLADLDAIAALEHQVYDEPWSEAMIRDELTQRTRIYLVVTEDGGVVGFGGLMLAGDDAHITTLGVAPEARHRGLGSRLLLILVERALDSGSRHLTLEVRASNTNARRLYERFGFAEVGKRYGYYRGEDAVVMWAIDIDATQYQQRLDGIRVELGEAA